MINILLALAISIGSCVVGDFVTQNCSTQEVVTESVKTSPEIVKKVEAILDSKKDEVVVYNYCIVGEWVYYVALGDEGIHKMSLDGTSDTIVCDLEGLGRISGSTQITSKYVDGYIYYTVSSLWQDDGKGNKSKAYPDELSRFNLATNTIEKIEDETLKANK